MKTERSDIKFPLWRKKVDYSLIEDYTTPIPNFLFDQWDIVNLFGDCFSKKDVNSLVSIVFKNEKYDGTISFSSRGIKKRDICRLSFDKRLGEKLKSVYVMSYMRSIEARLRKNKSEYKNEIIE